MPVEAIPANPYAGDIPCASGESVPTWVSEVKYDAEFGKSLKPSEIETPSEELAELMQIENPGVVNIDNIKAGEIQETNLAKPLAEEGLVDKVRDAVCGGIGLLVGFAVTKRVVQWLILDSRMGQAFFEDPVDLGELNADIGRRKRRAKNRTQILLDQKPKGYLDGVVREQAKLIELNRIQTAVKRSGGLTGNRVVNERRLFREVRRLREESKSKPIGKTIR